VQTNNAIDAAADLVRRDNDLPALGLLLDPARLLTKMSGKLDCSRVEAVKLVYLRYKPGMNCLARYELHSGGHTISAHAKAYGQDAARKIDKSIVRPVIDGILGSGRVVLKAQQMVFSTFPNDAKLASLQLLSEVDLRQRLFGRIFGLDSDWQRSEPGQALNYKPERRYVTRLMRADGESALAKFYSRSGYDKARTISRKLGTRREGFYPKTIGRSKKYAAVVYRWQAGITLRQLNFDGKLSLSNLATAAESLAEFHASGQDGLAPVEANEQAARLRELAQQTGFLLPHLEPRALRMVHRLVEWLAGQTPVRQPVHGDFYDKQAIVCDGHVRLIDLDAARLDDPLLDLGNYVAHLEKQAISHAMAVIDLETYRETLISSYEQSTGGTCMDQLNKYIALGLFALIHQPFRDWEADWPAQTERLLERVEVLFTA